MLDPEQFGKLKNSLSQKPITGDVSGMSGQQVAKPGYLERIKQSYLKRGENVVSDITRPAKLASEGKNPLKVAGAVAEAGLRTVGNVVGAAFDPLAEAVAPVIQPVISKLSENAKAASERGDIPGAGKNQIDWKAWGEKHPEAAKDLGAVFNIATLGAGKAVRPVTNTVSKVGSGAVEGTGKVLKNIGEKSYGVVAPMEKPTAQAMQSYQAARPSLIERLRGAKTTVKKPITEANTAARTGLVGTEWGLGVKAKRAANDLWENDLKQKLNASTNRTDMRKFIDELRDEVKADNADLSRRNTLLKAVDSLAEDFKSVRTPVSDAKLQNYKEGWAKFVPEKAYRNEPIAGALNEVRNMAASKARTRLYESLGSEAKQSYIDYSNLKSLEEAGLRTIDKLRDKSVFKQAWEFFVDKAITPVFSIGGKILYRTGEGFEFIGNPGLKKVGDILRSTGDVAATTVSQVIAPEPGEQKQ